MNGTIFGVGPLEVLVIGIIILLIFGPERLPEFTRGLGTALRRMRETYVGFTQEFKGELQPIAQDIESVTSEIRREVDAIREAADIRSILQPFTDDLNKAVKLEELKPQVKPITQDDIIRMNTPSSTDECECGDQWRSDCFDCFDASNGNTIKPPSPGRHKQAHAHKNGTAHAPTFSLGQGAVALNDDNPWANIGAPVRSDKLDDDSPWRL